MGWGIRAPTLADVARRVESADIAALARGCALLGSGGGGVTTYVELLARERSWPVYLHDVDELDPATPCVAAAFAGSTMVLAERLPGEDVFGSLIAAIEQWTGTRVGALCSFEAGGMNGLTPFVAGADRALVDADCMGRAFPRMDQVSLAVDGVPGLVYAVGTRAGVVVVETADASEAERVVRSALAEAGGTGAVVIGGFAVGDLTAHAMPGTLARALDLGRAALDAADEPLDGFARAIGGRVVATGRIRPTAHGEDPQVQAFEIAGDDARVHRLMTRTETLAVVTDGEVASASPEILAVVDARTYEVLEVPQLALAQLVAVIELPVAPWWRADPSRLARVVPSFYGLSELDAAA